MNHDMPMSGTPWLSSPVMLHSDRTYKCKFNDTAQCTYQQGYWRFWYEADHVFALPTVAFFGAVIAVFAIAFALQQLLPTSFSRAKTPRKLTALGRYLSYRSFRLSRLNWNSASLGVLLLAVVGTIFFLCMTFVPSPYYWPTLSKGNTYGSSPPLATRTGWLSIGCMPFVFATAGKSNLISLVTGVSYEKLQVFHRWISYVFFITALIHTFPFIVYHIQIGDMIQQWNTSVVYWTGVVALIAQAWLTFASWGPIRNLCYEWFKFSHFVAGLVFMIFFFFHCNFRLSSWDYFIASGVIYALSWLHRQLRVYIELGTGHKASVCLTKNGFIRIGVTTDSRWTAGQHYFIRFFTLGIHATTMHPFSACSLPERATANESKPSELVFYVRPCGGFTARLAKAAEQRPNSTVRVLLDGPYGGADMTKIEQSQRLLLIAGGSGSGWLLSFIIAHFRRLELAAATSEKGSAMPSLRVILATRELATKQWFEEAVRDIASAFPSVNASGNAEFETYLTGSGDSRVVSSEVAKTPEAAVQLQSESGSTGSSSDASSGFSHVDARPDLPAFIEAEAKNSAGPLGIFVCGPLSMQNDVSNAVAKQQLGIMKDGSKDVYLHMEHFSWA